MEYNRIQRTLRESARQQSLIVGGSGGSLFCESPALDRFCLDWGEGSPMALMRQVFGFEKFLPLQKEIVSCVLSGRDTLAVLPAGGGKSLCYQLGALLLGGMTIVVSPLIALMQDRVDKLRPRLRPFGMEVLCLHSLLSAEDYREACFRLEESCFAGKGALLYLAPESLASARTLRVIARLRDYIKLLAVEEAHCVSEWGHDFRPDYLAIGGFRTQIPHAACLALTATATRMVRQEIARHLGMERPEVFVGNFDRPNIFLEAKRRQRGLVQIESFLRRHRGECGIIYCFSRREADGMAEKLRARGFCIESCHAGLSDGERSARQKAWLSGRIALMAATVGFGMEMDKADVRFVIHACLPRSIEEYYQEVGRAGRDGRQSEALLLFGSTDAEKIRSLRRGKESGSRSRMQLQQTLRLKDMLGFASLKSCRRRAILSYFGQGSSFWQQADSIAADCCCDICRAASSSGGAGGRPQGQTALRRRGA